LMDDVGIPASYRTEDGWGIHTYKWINAAGKETWVRYYYQSAQGVKSLLDDEAVKMPFSFATTDLYESIKAGNFPQWTFYVQMIDPTDTAFMNNLTFDVLDTTKEWPADQIPMQKVGYFVLNENPISQFLENEMLAFSPSRMVPGIEPSDEKMLQTRLFAYMDTQRYRLGVNNQMLPINRPKCEYQDNHIDGSMHFLGTESKSAKEVNYFPSWNSATRTAAPFPHESEVVNGKKVREMISLTDDFEQPGKRYRSWDQARKDRFAQRVGATLSDKRVTDQVRTTWLGYWGQADSSLPAEISKYINATHNFLYL